MLLWSVPSPWRGYCFFWKLGHLLLRLCTKSDTSFLPNPYICPIDFCNYPKSTPCSFFRKKISSSLRQQFQMLTQWTKRDCLPALHWLFSPAIFKTAAGLGYFWLSLTFWLMQKIKNFVMGDLTVQFRHVVNWAASWISVNICFILECSKAIWS